MTELVTVENKEDIPNSNVTIMKKNIESNNNNNNNNNNTSNTEIEDITLSDNSNSQHTTINNSNESTPSNSNSPLNIESNIESKSNTELSIDIDDNDSTQSNDNINDINDIPDDIIPPNNSIHHEVSHAYRKLLVHESQRLKAENGRLLRKVEKMRCIRTSMQNIFEQLQNNDQQLQHELKQDNDNNEQQEEEELEIEHLNDLNNYNSRINHTNNTNGNTHKQFLLKQKQREERKKLRQQRLLRFAQTRQQIHNNHTTNSPSNNNMSYLSSFIPRICSRPLCNHPLRITGSRSNICCRGCIKGKHTPTCTQRALKMIQNRHIQNNNNNHRSHSHGRHNHRRTQSATQIQSVKYLYCDKCRSKFNSIIELERHKSIHHSPVIASSAHSIITHTSTPPRLPPPIPELTSSFHTTMPNQTKNKFRYKPSGNINNINDSINDNNNDNVIDMENENNISGLDEHNNNSNNNKNMSRLSILSRRIRKSNNNGNRNENNDRKRKHSLTQLFNTLMTHTRRNSNENTNEQKEMELKEDIINRNGNRNNSNELHLFEDDTPMIHHDTHTHTQRKRLHELRRKLEQRKQRKNNKLLLESKNATENNSNWDDDIELPPVPEIEEKEEKVSHNSIRRRDVRRDIRNIRRDVRRDIHRPRHRRCNAISNDIIMPYITTSDGDDNDMHEEEEKSIQPIENSNELDILALRRKVRDRKLRRNHGSFNPLQSTHNHSHSHYSHRNNGNPFRHSHTHRSHSSHRHSRTRSHSHRHNEINNSSNNNNSRRNGSQNFTYRNTIMSAANNSNSNRPRLRQPFIMNENDSLDIIHRRRRNLMNNNNININERRRRRRNTLNVLSIGSDSSQNLNDNNSISSLQVNVNTNNTNRDEEIARLLQQRDSLLQHFHDTIRNTHIQSTNNNNNNSRHRHSHSHTINSFDSNALRQRNRQQNNSNNNLHRHSLSMSCINNKLDLTYLPIRDVKESDIRKGNISSANCSICQEKFKIGDKVKTLPCFHFFHVNEIDRWLTSSRVCPVCRHSIDQINFK